MQGTTQTFGSKLREHRKANGLSLHKAADITGLSFTTISRLENGHHAPTQKTADKLKAIGFNVTEDDLYSLSKESLEVRVNALEQQMDSLVEDLLQRVSALEARGADLTPSEARELLLKLSEAYSPEQIKEWTANLPGSTKQPASGGRTKRAKRQPQRA